MNTRVICATTLALLALGSPLTDGARAYVTEGQPWPQGVIRYYNAAPDQAWAVHQAVAAWNSSGAGVRFVAVPAEEAEVRIEHFQGVACTINAEATVGYGPNARVYVFRRDERSPFCNSYMAARALAHELGHVLGLGHETRGCSLMNPSGTLQGPSLCSKGHLWQWRCQLLTPDDVAGAIALYGGTAASGRGPRDCDLYAGIRAPGSVRIAGTPAEHEYVVSLRRPRSVSVPAFLSSQNAQPESFATSAVAGRCSTSTRGLVRRAWHVEAGKTERTYVRLAPGTYCLSVWAFDSFGRPSPRSARLWVRIL